MERIRVKNNAAGHIAGAAYGLIPFVLGLVLGLALAGLFIGWRSGREREQLRERAGKVDRDLGAARRAQQDAQERAGRLQEELGSVVGMSK